MAAVEPAVSRAPEATVPTCWRLRSATAAARAWACWARRSARDSVSVVR
ncbi:hypothetical protein HMPREF0185_03399 [Brevundimonas diminuta 470-4]|nr:hypothetical protein HMPREF0185_03399 [Brevundimonas diminuta 470-4]